MQRGAFGLSGGFGVLPPLLRLSCSIFVLSLSLSLVFFFSLSPHPVSLLSSCSTPLWETSASYTSILESPQKKVKHLLAPPQIPTISVSYPATALWSP